MFSKKTVTSFNNLIYLECFICINRSYLIDNNRVRSICNFIYFFIVFSIICYTIYDFPYDSNIDFNILIFQAVFTVELVGLSVAACCLRKQYKALQKLDEKFGLDGDYVKILKGEADVATITTIASMIVDISGMIFLTAKRSSMIIICLGTAAHDAELAFISLFIKVVNIRLEKSITESPGYGCTVYRHILIAASYFNEGFQFSVFLIMLVTLLTSIIYGFVVVLLDSDMAALTVSFLAWREFKSLYSLWAVCSAAHRTEGICRQLAWHLTSKLVLEPKTANSNSKSFAVLKRWHASVMAMQPRFTAGQGIALNLSIPLVIVDVSINYLLLVIQFYMAYQ